MESLTLNPLSPRKLFPILHPYPQTFPRSQTRRHRLFIHAQLPHIHLSSSSYSLRNPQFLNSPTNICISTCKTVTFAILFAFLSFTPISASRLLPAIALTSMTRKTEKGETFTDHEFSAYTRRLLSLVSVLLSRIEDVKSGNGDMNGVKKALREIKASRREIEDEVIGNLNAELNEMKRVNVELGGRLGKVVELAKAAMNELDALSDGVEMDGERRRGKEELEKEVGDLEEEYNDLVAKVGEIEDRMMRRESLTYSVAVRELSFIEKESELLVQRFGRRIMRYNFRLPVRRILDLLISNVHVMGQM